MDNSEYYDVRIAGIETVSFSLSERPQGMMGEVFNFDLVSHNKANDEKSLLFTRLNLNIREKDKPEILGHVNLIFSFELKNFKELIKFDDKTNKFIVPDDLEFHLRTLALSSSRGIMYSLFRGTYLHGAMLPVIGKFPMLEKVPNQE